MGPHRVKRLIPGFVVNAKYTLGANTGNAFQQVYAGGTVLGTPIAGPNVGVKFPTEDYVAIPISNDQVYTLSRTGAAYSPAECLTLARRRRCRAC